MSYQVEMSVIPHQEALRERVLYCQEIMPNITSFLTHDEKKTFSRANKAIHCSVANAELNRQNMRLEGDQKSGGMMSYSDSRAWHSALGASSVAKERFGASDASIRRPNISQLSLSDSEPDAPIDNARLAENVRNFPHLKNLKLAFCRKINGAGLAPLADLHDLEILDLSNCEMISDAGLPYLAQLSKLQCLNLSFCPRIRGIGLNYLANLHELKELNLENCFQASDGDLAFLANLKKLQKLNLSECEKLTNACLRYLSNLHELQELDLTAINIGSGGCKLKYLQKLQNLRLARCGITDTDLEYLANLNDLIILNLRECTKVTGSGLAHLARLRELNLTGCTQLTGNDLSQLHLPELKWLDLTNCRQITDEILARLPYFPNLERIDLSGCAVTNAGCEELKQRYPELEIVNMMM